MWYHGTNQRIDKFRISNDIQGLNTGSSFCSNLIYFTKDTKLASSYADGAAGKLYPEDHIGHVKKLDDWQNEYNRLMDNNKFDEADELLEKIEEYEYLLSESLSGHCIYPVNLEPKKFKVFDFNGKDWGGEKAEKLINLAMKKGLDAIFICNVIDKIDMLNNQGIESATDIAIVLNESCIKMSLSKNDCSVTPELISKINKKENQTEYSI